MAESDSTIDLLNLQFTGTENEQQYIIFMVGKEEFGLEVLKVQEIIRYQVPTQIPHAPTYVEGVIDFRGEVIPVLSMRKRFGLPEQEDFGFQVIVVTEVNGKIIGLTVDRVLDIANIPEDKIQLATDFTAQEKTRYLRAMGKLGNRLILLLDLNKIMDFEDEKLMNDKMSSEEIILNF
ncbi:MAG TPA: chemotaxis protein CheW [Firmicutes bacterium]|nr:chemotaxis protein CheW [Bacillota bacterium]